MNRTLERKETDERFRVMGFLEDHVITGFEYPPSDDGRPPRRIEPYAEKVLRACGWEPWQYMVTDESIIFCFLQAMFSPASAM